MTSFQDSFESLKGLTFMNNHNPSPSLLSPCPSTSLNPEDPLKGITKEMKMRIVGCVRDNPCIWNYNNPEYRSTPIKRQAWNNLAAMLKDQFPETHVLHDPDMIKTVWKNLLDYWRVVDKRMNHKDAAAEPSWIYYDPMSFLKPVRGTELIKHRSARAEMRRLKRERSKEASSPDNVINHKFMEECMKDFQAIQKQWGNFSSEMMPNSNHVNNIEKENESVIELKRIKVDSDSEANTASEERHDSEMDSIRQFSIDYDELSIEDVSKYTGALEDRLRIVKKGDRRNYITCLKKVWDVVFEYELRSLSTNDYR
uniref:MADF domain-containing protein n=1 Tax=Rhabditophanes sp. KR3021 TaxID=114890 RepID=A0AC35U1E5_9BILA